MSRNLIFKVDEFSYKIWVELWIISQKHHHWSDSPKAIGMAPADVLPIGRAPENGINTPTS